MTLPLATLRLMVEKGMSPQEILEFAETLCNGSSVTESVTPRSANAERQARFRANRKAGCVTAAVTNNANSNATNNVTSVTPEEEAPPLPPPPLLPPQTPPITPPPPAPPHETGTREGDDLFSGEKGDEDEKQGPEKPKKVRKSKSTEPFIRPDDIPEDAWVGFEEMRQRKRAFLTDRARHGIVKKLRKFAEDGHPPGDVLDQSTMNSYTDVYKLKDRNNGTGNRSGPAEQYPDGFRDPVLARMFREASP